MDTALVAFYDIRPGNRVGLLFQPGAHNVPGCQSLHRAITEGTYLVDDVDVSSPGNEHL